MVPTPPAKSMYSRASISVIKAFLAVAMRLVLPRGNAAWKGLPLNLLISASSLTRHSLVVSFSGPVPTINQRRTDTRQIAYYAMPANAKDRRVVVIDACEQYWSLKCCESSALLFARWVSKLD